MQEIADCLNARAGWLRKFRATGGTLSPHEVAMLVRDLESCADAVREVAAVLREAGGAPDGPPTRPRPSLRLVGER